MGDAFGVNFAALDCAAGDFAAVESGLREADIAGPFEGISEALPGSRTMVASLWISTRLGASVQVWDTILRALTTLINRDSASAKLTAQLGFAPAAFFVGR